MLTYMANLQKFIEHSYDALLERTQDVPIVLLHPQSNYRSVVVARLMAEAPKPVFYHALASYDVNVEAFLSGLTHNLSERAPTFGWHLSKLASQTAKREEIVEGLVNELSELSDDPFYLVLDHYDASDHADDVQELLEDLLNQLPSHCQVIINSRTLPRMPWLALVARRVAVILGDEPAEDDGLYRASQRGALAKLDVRCLGPSTIQKHGKIIDDWEGHLPRLLLIFALVGAFLLAQNQGLLGNAASPPNESIQFTLYYNDGSFHLHNSGPDDMLNMPLAFERLDTEGNASHRFDGARWAEFSEMTLTGWCVSVTVFRSPPYLEPPECGNRYNSTLQPTRSVDFLFWRSDLDGDTFRVLWNDYEIGRCLVAAGECAVTYP